MNLENDTALITGSSGGIGEEFAVQLARRGANLVLVARREDKLTALRSRLLEQRPGLSIDVIAADLAVPGSAAELTGKVASLGRRIDILVNNAGVGLHGDFAKQEVDDNAAQIQLNCVTLVELTGSFLPAMTRAGHGLVINVASTAAFQPTPGMAVYGATKAFVLSFTEALWQETKSTGVRVLTLCPGATETEFFARTGEEFLTSGRQTSTQVVDTALAALDKSTPTVVSGLRNVLLANGYRVTPRRLMLQVSEHLLKAN
ncbi:SDR family NAD(P)-dependent oxidoreductase [Mycolicibacterium komossense]|uniref:SDR family oxidoreductase n=1 Tax=Mycolicibacterium komossense TaxID=1779 RepID=A0ABT3C5Q0_9MYCO|nr:SDR family oxidoreductase [Mycolicibacterium komossense]MCV7224804.1 SDR family oxidoreductase [Mycolicibacterium komossense]